MSTETLTTDTETLTEDKALDKAMANDKSASFNGDGKALVRHLQSVAKPLTKIAQAFAKADADLIDIALAIVSDLRCELTFNGVSNLTGKGPFYSMAYGALMDRLLPIPADASSAVRASIESDRETLRNRLGKRITRTSVADGHTFTQGVVNYVIRRDKLSVSDTQRETLRTLYYAGTKSVTDKKVVAIVAAVNDLCAAARKAQKSPALYSQFERKFVASNAPKSNGAANDTNVKAQASATHVAEFAASVTQVAIGDSLTATLVALVNIGESLTNGAGFGDGGRERVSALLTDISWVAYGIDCEVQNVEMDGESAASYRAAMDRVNALLAVPAAA